MNLFYQEEKTRNCFIFIIGQEGEIRVYLPIKVKEKTDLYIETKRGNIPQHKQRGVKNFINDYHDLIITRIENELKKVGIKLK